jgi:hypothetical protein
VAALLVGGAAGFALGRRTVPRAPAPNMTLLGVSRATLLDSLGLTPAQRVRIDSLLEDARSRADLAVDRLVSDVRALTLETRNQVRSLLDDRQRVQLDSILDAASPVLPRTPVPPRR